MSAMTVADLARAANTTAPPGGTLTPVVPALKSLDARTGRELVTAIVADVKRNIATGTSPDGSKFKPLRYGRPRGGNSPLRDTGRLMASITGRSDRTSVTVGSAHPGAAIQNFGGVIRPKRAKFLSIPLTKEAARAGSPRRMKGTPRTPLFAKLVGGKMVGHFLLVKKVTVPKREFMGLSKQGERAVAAILTDAAVRQWQAGRGI